MDCRVHQEVSIRLSELLLKHANRARPNCEHDGCLILDGIMRDCALQIHRLAQDLIEEIERRDLETPIASANEGGRR